MPDFLKWAQRYYLYLCGQKTAKQLTLLSSDQMSAFYRSQGLDLLEY